MSGQGIHKVIVGAVLVAVAGGLTAAGVMFRTTDVSAEAASAEPTEVVIPEIPPVSELAPAPTDAFTRPLFAVNRQPGPDKAPVFAPADGTASPDPDAESTAAAASFRLRGVIIGERGARVALLPEGAAAPTWAGIGDVVDGWTVEAINAERVRVRNGEEVSEFRFDDE